MRIALDCRSVSTPVGGIGRYAWSLLREYMDIGCDHEFVCWFTHRMPREPFRITRDVRVRVFDAGMVDERFDQLIAPGLLEEDAIDLYHNPMFAVPAVRGRAKFVSTVHDVVFARRPDLVEPKLRDYLDRATRRACRSADRIVTVSEFSKREIVAAYGVDAGRIRTIHNGVHAPGPTGGAAILETLGVAAEPFVLYVGSVEPKKNIGLLLDGFEILRRRGGFEELKLVVAGPHGGPENELEGRVGSTKGVVRVGYVGDRDLETLYSRARVFVYPSLYEGFGLPPLEAMLRGVPTVVADTSSLPEVVGDAALIVSPADATGLADAMASLLSDQALRHRLIDAGRLRAEPFTWRRSAEQHLEVYEQAMR